MANASKATGIDLSKVPIIICDTGDSKSVLDMANQAKVVLNCVGPYRYCTYISLELRCGIRREGEISHTETTPYQKESVLTLDFLVL